MKYTTAKTILKIYRKEGRFGKKKQRVKKDFAKLASSSLSGLPQEKQVSVGCSTTSHACAPPDTHKEEGFNQAFKALESTLAMSFWGSRISEHFT